MKKIFAAFAAAVACLSFAACSTTQQADASTKLAQLQTIVVNGCMVVQPTLTAVAVVDPAVATAATANGLFCATAGAITVTSVQSLVSTGIPAIEQAVAASTLIAADQKPLVVAALGLFQMTVSNALAVYVNATASAPAPTSGASTVPETTPASQPAAA